MSTDDKTPPAVRVHTPQDVVDDLLVAGVNLTSREQKLIREAIERRDQVWQAIVEAMRT